MNKKINALSILVLFSLGLLISFLSFSAFNSNKSDVPQTAINVEEAVRIKDSLALANSMPKELFGLPVNSFIVKNYEIARNENLSVILARYGVNPVTISELVKKSKSIFNVRNIVAGKPYTVFASKSIPDKAEYFVYQPNVLEYIVYDLRDTVKIHKGKKDIETTVETIGGTIKNSLYEALQESGGDADMATQLSKIFGGVINFYAIQEGDWFKIQYENNYVDGEVIGSGKISSAIFSHRGKEYQAHYFQTDPEKEGEYYDADGVSLRRSFLRAPLKYSRISSRFTKRRLHPVQKVWKAHLGTDYAAPHGTPIIATGDGVVVESGSGRGNGNYVKIKHNKTYATQYLHMSRRAVKKGQRIRQGQVIGYVGSTGLATGPHVCYRFWKNGVQVDPLRQNIKMITPIPQKYVSDFKEDLDRVRMEFAVTPIEQPVEETRYALFEERPSSLFKYFDGNESDNTI